MGIFDRAKEPPARRTEAGDDRVRERGGPADEQREQHPQHDAPAADSAPDGNTDPGQRAQPTAQP
jgi:hypothetical protein